jgi:Predicted membrane protein
MEPEPTQLDAAIRLAVAALAGMAVGLEREWSGHATGPAARFAGVRTFFLLGAIGGLAGWLLAQGQTAISSALLLGASALVVAAYLTAARRTPEAIDGTTETAAILVLGTGLLAGIGSLALASGIVAVTLLLLGEKEAIRAFVKRIGPEEMFAALRFAVLALVVLPLLPEGPFGPFGGIRPRSLWMVVLIFSAINFVGYVVRRAVGDTRGYLATGALGGLVSSTAVTLTFSRQSRTDQRDAPALAAGTVAACTVLVLRVLTVILVMNAALAPAVAFGIWPMFVAGGVLLLIAHRRLGKSKANASAPEAHNPLRLGSAIAMAIGFQAVLMILELFRGQFGDPGVYASAALAGLTDMDALTFGMSRLAADTSLVPVAARALLLGVIVNTLFKCSVALVLGGSTYRRLAVPGLLLLAAAGGAGLWLATLR